ncbi:MAG: AlpA family transcriptional regulator [Coxiella sp. (in: Bacteria)]|nr:MAG: AlpA family transcriptional regulator [Coxiella sp. (in: g-proteobacteria)]
MILNIAEVSNRIKLSPSTIKRLEKAGKFPAARKILASRSVWYVADIDVWITKQIGTPGDKNGVKPGGWMPSWT